MASRISWACWVAVALEPAAVQFKLHDEEAKPFSVLSCFPVFLSQFRVAAGVKSFDATFRVTIFLIFVSFVYFASGVCRYDAFRMTCAQTGDAWLVLLMVSLRYRH